ncbi:hypothetical protein S4A8_14774 [Salinisphaera sp. S4-8]
MWFRDKGTAKRVAEHRIKVHETVAGDVIDVGYSEPGGYGTNAPRNSMWATLTELHSVHWIYERLAFRRFRFRAG